MFSSVSSSSVKQKRSRGYVPTDYSEYNRAELMRRQELGLEIQIGQKPAPEPQHVVNKPTVTITNLNINADDGDEKEDESKDQAVEKAKEEKQQLDVYEAKEDLKKIEIRHNHNWFVMKYQNSDEFYQFLDKFSIFGLLAEEDGCLIITHYDDLIADKKYRTGM